MSKRENDRERKQHTDAPIPERLTCSIGGLDVVLGGGLLARRSYLVKGPPGSGKTVLAAQYCCDHARRGLRSTFVTMLTESHAILLENLRTFSFFEERFVGKSLTFVSGHEPLSDKGLAGLTGLLRDMLRKQRPSLLVIDSIGAIIELTDSIHEAKRFFRDLASICEVVGCTSVYLSLAHTGPKYTFVETVLDGSVELFRLSSDLLTFRALQVQKFRGSAHLEGKHVFDITSAGLALHPRIESRHVMSVFPPAEDKARIPFGVETLDDMLEGGLTSASTTVLSGPSGVGKTILGLQFLCEGARRGEPSLYLGFFESPPRLIAKAQGVGIPLLQHERQGLVELVWQPPLGQSIDAIADSLLGKIRERHVGRLFVDGLDAFRACAVYPSRLTQFLAALANELRARGVTTLFSEELVLFGPEIAVHGMALSAVFENLLLLRYVELNSELHRVVSVLKTRESDFDKSIREFRISREGIQIGDPLRGAERVLSGYAHPTQTGRTKNPLRSKRRRS